MKAGYTIQYNGCFTRKDDIVVIDNINRGNLVLITPYESMYLENYKDKYTIGVFQPKGTKAKRDDSRRIF